MPFRQESDGSAGSGERHSAQGAGIQQKGLDVTA